MELEEEGDGAWNGEGVDTTLGGCAFGDGDRGWDNEGVGAGLGGCGLRDGDGEGLVLEPKGDREGE